MATAQMAAADRTASFVIGVFVVSRMASRRSPYRVAPRHRLPPAARALAAALAWESVHYEVLRPQPVCMCAVAGASIGATDQSIEDLFANSSLSS